MIDSRRIRNFFRALRAVTVDRIDWGRLVRRIRNGFRAVWKDRKRPPAARGRPLPRTEAWKHATTYTYKGITVLDERTRIILAFKNAPVQRGGAAAAVGWQAGQLLSGLAVAVGVMLGIFGQAHIAMPLAIGGILVGILAYKGTAASGDGAFGVQGNRFFFKDLMSGDVVKVSRDLFQGVLVDRRSEVNFASRADEQPLEYYYVAVRFGAVRVDMAAFRSGAVAEQLAVLINEAMRQTMTPTADPAPSVLARASTPQPSPGVRFKDDDDL
jgi:hypothetical protein